MYLSDLAIFCGSKQSTCHVPHNLGSEIDLGPIKSWDLESHESALPGTVEIAFIAVFDKTVTRFMHLVKTNV
jgi:hypothetical protein